MVGGGLVLLGSCSAYLMRNNLNNMNKAPKPPRQLMVVIFTLMNESVGEVYNMK